MSLEAIACNQCGAPLQVPDAAQFVTCNHCGASLAVRRDGTITYTEVLSQLSQQTANLSEQVAQLRYQNAVDQVDRRWEKEREKLLVRSKDGTTYEPSSSIALLIGGAMAVVGIILTAGTSFGSMGLWLVGGGIFYAVLGGFAGAKFEKAKSHYRKRRAMLSIDQFRGEANDEVSADEIPDLK
jgi:hypothetical protein